ncbi:unnamed protein product [Prunus brigantina]
MVATVCCKEIANEKYADFSGNEEWSQLAEVVQFGPISGFGKKLSSIFDTCLSEYDAQATYFDEGVRTRKRKQLEEKLLQLVQPAFRALLGHIRSGSLDKFKEAFDKALNGEEAFSVAARNCSESFMALFDEGCAGMKNWRMPYQDRLEALLDGVNGETWPSIRNLFLFETESAVSGISSAFSGFDMDEQSKGKTLSSLEAYARGVVEAKTKEEAGRVLTFRSDDYAADNIENTLSLALKHLARVCILSSIVSIGVSNQVAFVIFYIFIFCAGFLLKNIDQTCRVQILVEEIQAMD